MHVLYDQKNEDLWSLRKLFVWGFKIFLISRVTIIKTTKFNYRPCLHRSYSARNVIPIFSWKKNMVLAGVLLNIPCIKLRSPRKLSMFLQVSHRLKQIFKEQEYGQANNLWLWENESSKGKIFKIPETSSKWQN